jgi:hypothetical protein
VSTLEALHELRRMATDWPAHVEADDGTRYAFSGVVTSDGYGMYDGTDGYAFTLAQARAFSPDGAL